MKILITINGATRAPLALEKVLLGSKIQLIEVDEILDQEDTEELESYINSLEAENIYVLYSDSNSQPLNVIKESTIKVDAFFTCL